MIRDPVPRPGRGTRSSGHFTALAHVEGASPAGAEARLAELSGARLVKVSPTLNVAVSRRATVVRGPGRIAAVGFAGRIDADPASTAREGPEEAAAALAQALEREGDAGLDRFEGQFAVLWWDAVSSEVCLACDRLGDQPVYYHSAPGRLVASTDLGALLRVAGIRPQPDWTSLAQHFAMQPLAPGDSFFAGVRVARPGEVLAVDAGLTLRRRPGRPLCPRGEAAGGPPAAELRRRLETSVRRKAAAPSAILLSGGLDSSAVTALVAASAAARDAPPPLAISWVLADPAASEHGYLDQVIHRTGARWERLEGDDDWPLKDLETLEVGLESPTQDPYQRLMDRSFAAASEHGCGTLLTGHFADELFLGTRRWWRSVPADGRWGRLLPLLAAEAKARWPERRDLPRRLARRLWAVPSRRAEWLTPEAAAMVAWPPEPRGARFLDAATGPALQARQTRADRWGVSVRYPFRDSDLASWLLTAPVADLHLPGRRKWLLAEAMRGDLPESVRLRPHAGSLLPLVRKGLLHRELDTVRRILSDPGASWPLLVRREAVEDRFFADLEGSRDGSFLAVGWMCISLELWLAELAGWSSRATGDGIDDASQSPLRSTEYALS